MIFRDSDPSMTAQMRTQINFNFCGWEAGAQQTVELVGGLQKKRVCVYTCHTQQNQGARPVRKKTLLNTKNGFHILQKSHFVDMCHRDGVTRMTCDSTLGTPKSEPKAVLHPLHHASLCSSVPSASIATAAAARAAAAAEAGGGGDGAGCGGCR